MEINVSRHVDQLSRQPAPMPRIVRREDLEKSPEFSQSVMLESKLLAQPDVRAGAVERARELINSSGYPPAATIQKMADLLAYNLQEQD